MSEREMLTQRVSDLCGELRLNEVYGVLTGISADKKYRYATFCRARVLDGEVRVYGPHYILVRWQTRIATLPWKGSEVFRSFDDFEKWMREKFGRGSK